MRAVVLAGGFGTRLQSVVSDVPKPMAPVAGRPFLEFVLESLRPYVDGYVLSVGYLSEAIVQHFGPAFQGVPIIYSVEETPLGTGGGVAKAARLMQDVRFVVVNGDTLFPVDIERLVNFHLESRAAATLALTTSPEQGRYGTVELSPDGKVSAFREKTPTAAGVINGGVYVFEAEIFNQQPEVFSLESALLTPLACEGRVYGLSFPDYFIDIGIPADYKRAEQELSHRSP